MFQTVFLTDVAHRKWGEGEFHLEDIGNITVSEDGVGSIELTTDLWEISTGSDVDVVDRGLIVYEFLASNIAQFERILINEFTKIRLLYSQEYNHG